MKKAASPRVTPWGGTRSDPSMLGPGSSLSNPRSRTPSPSHGLRSAASRPGLGSSLQLSMTEEESEDGADGEPRCENDERRSPGVRYITEDLIKRVSKQDSLAFVRSLNLSLAKSGSKKFKFIENLEKCERLQVLNLNHNLIEKIEKLEKLHRLRELHLSHNRIRKIEGLEHMGSLQLLNLAGNNIEHLPLWLAKRLRSLNTLNLQGNNICSLHELLKLKPLKNLTELLLMENPVFNLPHYRLFLVFHLRTLERLDGQVITQQERELAYQRFHMEEVERLEQDLEARRGEVESLREERSIALQELEQQGALNQSLKLQCQEQKQCQAELERELETKNQLLKQKTMELTRACQKQYELEQELAFHKIDAKFEPLPYYPDQEYELEAGLPVESPYIGKARQKRNPFVPEAVAPDGQLGHTDTDAPPSGGSTDPPGYGHAQVQAAEERLGQLRREIESAEQQILRASAELRQLEDAVSQKRITEAEKEQLRQQLRGKMSLLQEARGEAQALEAQLDRSRDQMSRAQGELEQLQDALDGLDPGDPRHAHVRAQVSSKTQQLDIMSRKCRELEARLDDMLTRIAKETEEIKDLEQQLTDGQIAANEALKRDLEGIIAGLQEYLQGVKGQARRAQADCHRLERERDALQRRLQDSEEQRSQLEIVAMDAESAREGAARLERELDGLREAETQVSAYEAELEVQLQQRDTEAGQLREELGRLRRLSQMERSAVQAELDKERQAKENALVQVQLASERQQENQRLLAQLHTLQEERSLLRGQLSALQGELEEARGSLLNPQEVTQRLEDLRRSISSGLGEVRPRGEGDALGGSLAQLQQELRGAVSAAQAERDEARGRQGRLTQEAAALRDRLRRAQEEHRAACDSAAQARVAAERREGEMEAELRRLREELREVQEVQSLTERQLHEAEEERDRLLAELEDRANQTKVDESRTRQQLRSLEDEVREMKRSMTSADKMAAQQLTAAKDQLRSLHGTVRKINQERAEDAEEMEGFRTEAAAAAQDLARAEAEIQLLQKLLKDREQQIHELDSNAQGVPSSAGQQLELERLSRALDRQQAQTKRLWEQLAQAREDNRGNLEELVEEIAALRDTLAQQCSFVSNLGDPHRSRGCWYYVPSPPNPPSVGSQGTRDSGLGSQYPPSPERGRRRGRKEREDQAGGYWMFSPLRSRRTRTRGRRGEPQDSGGESDGDSSASGRQYTVPPDGSALPHGAVIYAPPAAGLSLAPGAVVYGPPPPGAPLVYGPPAASFHAPLVPAGVLHCNVPGHQDMERELAQLLGQKRKEEHLSADVQRLQDQRADLEEELQELRRAVSRMRRRRESLVGSGNSLVEEVQESLRQQGEALEEVECVEETLLRRRAELREADRLLLEAESDLKDTRAKTKEILQRYGKAQQRVGDTELELEELEKRAQDSATQLVEANLQLRTLQEEVQELRRQRVEEEQTLQEVEEVVESQDALFQDLSSKVQTATERLEALQSELDQAESREARHLETLREAESMLGQRRSELDALTTRVAQQQEELAVLNRKLGQRREEDRLLQESGEQRRRSLVEVLKQGEEEVQDLQRNIKELRADLATLSALKGELDSQVVEQRAGASLAKQEAEREEETLRSVLAQISKHKAELKYMLEMVELETSELEGVKLQHEQRLDQLEQSQESLLQVRVELEKLAQVAQQQRAEGERQRRQLEQERAELEALQLEAGGARESVEAQRRDRAAREEQCRNLEARRGHAERCLATAEEGARAAEAELTRLEAELDRMKREHRRARGARQETSRDAASAQRQLEEKREELKGLQETLSDARQQLQQVEEEVRAATSRHEELLEEQHRQEEELEKGAERAREVMHRGEELEAELDKKHARLQQQEKSLQVLQQDALDTEELRAQRLQKLQSQLQAVEGALAERGEQLQRAAASASGAEERKRLGRELSAREEELETLRGELADCQEEVQHLQEALLTERRDAERRLSALRVRGQAERDEMEQERVRLQRELVAVDQAARENHQRAKDLEEELNCVSQELLGLRDKLRSQEEGETRRRGIREAMRSLRSEVRAEIRELETPPSDASDTESLKENHPLFTPSLGRVAFSTKDEQWRGEALREKLQQQEDHLKAQLRRRMWSQEEALSQRRQQTEGSLQGLRRRVDKLDELVNGSADFPTPGHSEPPLKHGRPDVPEAGRSLGGSARSCSPVRLDPALPEKDQGSSW
ncbi:centriolin isoform X1 [Anguilla rostrata]|uniref:centriolin isoform X1 n=2 Tax=Anguilla rostrata TaxID=7938 RepID=UPI0030D59735